MKPAGQHRPSRPRRTGLATLLKAADSRCRCGVVEVPLCRCVRVGFTSSLHRIGQLSCRSQAEVVARRGMIVPPDSDRPRRSMLMASVVQGDPSFIARRFNLTGRNRGQRHASGGGKRRERSRGDSLRRCVAKGRDDSRGRRLATEEEEKHAVR